MRRESHGLSKRTAAPPPAEPGLLQVGEQRVHHLHDGPHGEPRRDRAPGSTVQDVVGHGGDRGGGPADCVHHWALCLPEHVHLTGRSRFPLAFKTMSL